VYDSVTGELLERVDPFTVRSKPLYLSENHGAIVRDTSFFGATSPIYGMRARMEVAQSLGTLQYTTALADYRRYFMPVTPFTLAVRGLHFGRYGRDAEDVRIAEMFLGYPEFVRGYGLESFDALDCADRDAGGVCSVFNSLRGSRLLVANVELRAPLFGLFKRDLVYGRLPVEVGAFFDAGVAWTSGSQPAFMGGTREVVKSAGGLARVNLLGFVVVEISAARPFNRAAHGWQWQVGLKQGF
jgi:outer membrane protein assembly factor BamA